MLILNDQHFLGAVAERIERRLMAPEAAVEDAYCVYAARLTASRDDYLRARLEDLRDSCQLIVEALVRGEAGFVDPTEAGHGAIFVSPHLHASAVLRARRAGAVGFVSRSKALLSHGAILLRASGIPSLGALSFPEELVVDGLHLLVDGMRGELVIDPSPGRIKKARDLVSNGEPVPGAAAEPSLDAKMPSGEAVRVWANIDNPAQTDQCLTHRMHGIGLLRTEFMALSDGWVPPEDEQVDIYYNVADRIGQRPLVIRTFDIGAEKVPEGLRDDLSSNPALGLRGLRRHLVRFPEELRTQLRAILRGTVGADAAILFPMVTNVDDIRAALEHLEFVRAELQSRDVPHNRAIKVASMIEVPAAALNVRLIAEHVDFVAIGTNDLSQYLSAADRDSAEVSAYLDPKSSGVLEMIGHVMREMTELGRSHDVLVGGELASDPMIATQLVKLGVRSLIVNPQSARRVRAAIEGNV